MAFQTEIQFTLPKGYLGADGTLHKEGLMRLATAADEILPLEGSAGPAEPRVPDRHPAVARRDEARQPRRACTPASSKGCTPRTCRTCRRSTRT